MGELESHLKLTYNYMELSEEMGHIDFYNYMSRLTLKAMLYEVSATPKPGLVDRSNPGAHKDMDFFTFMDSSLALYDYFYNCTKKGYEYSGNNLLEQLRPIGIRAESQMLNATGGANTHKGLIFSMGIIVAVAGKLYKKSHKIYFNSKEISEFTKEISSGITKELMDINSGETYGENIYLLHGFTGIRGEVESGFKTIRDVSLPVLKGLILKSKYHINDIMVECLLHLIANLKDTNILGRHGLRTLEYAKKQAEKAINLGGYLSEEGKEFVKVMDKDFIIKNISPGGSADLLAITLLLYFMENGDKINGR